MCSSTQNSSSCKRICAVLKGKFVTSLVAKYKKAFGFRGPALPPDLHRYTLALAIGPNVCSSYKPLTVK